MLRQPAALIADAVGLGKDARSAGILCSELYPRGRGKRILVVTTKSMLGEFQKEFWTRFFHPRWVRLIQLRHSAASASTFPPTRTRFTTTTRPIVSVDTLKNDRDTRFLTSTTPSWDNHRDR